LWLKSSFRNASNQSGGALMGMSMFVSFLGVLLITLVVLLAVWAIGRITLGQ
jgi:hypothetical protein